MAFGGYYRFTTRSNRPLLSNLQKLLSVADKVVQETFDANEQPLSSRDMAVAELAAKSLNKQLKDRDIPPDIQDLWDPSGRDIAWLVALFWLALRRSSPFANGSSPAPAFTHVREALAMTFNTSGGTADRSSHRRICHQILGPALLGADTLECYSQLLATAAEQLKPAATAVTSAGLASLGLAAGLPRAHGQAAASAAGRTGQQQQRSPRAEQPSLPQLQALLNEVMSIVTVVGFTDASGLPIIDRTSTSGCNSSSSSIDAPGSDDEAHPALRMHARVLSSWVLEHWARVLLLGTAVACSGGSSRRRMDAQCLQAKMTDRLCRVLAAVGMNWAGFVGRPWGAAVSFIHVAHLCAALDGGDVCGLDRPEVIYLKGTTIGVPEPQHLLRADPAATDYDGGAMGRCRAVSLQVAIETVKAWIEALRQPQGGSRGQDAGDVVGDVAQEQQGPGVRGHSGVLGCGGGSQEASRVLPVGEGAVVGRLPPQGRAATVTVCLRLAKGVLASWAKPLPGVQLHVADGAPLVQDPLLPKGNGSSLVFHTLLCARLALLPDVWGRARLRGRVRTQLRAWWETYVAAVQHPDALSIAHHQLLPFPEWKHEQGLISRLSADAAVALEAGLLPCMTALTTCFGVDNIHTGWLYPPSAFPGTNTCEGEMLLFGPLGQVAENMAAVGRRARLAVEELRGAVAAAGAGDGAAGGSGGRGGQGVDVLGQVARQMVDMAMCRLCDVLGAYTGAAEGSNAPPPPVVDMGVPVGSGGVASGAQEEAAAPQSNALAVRASYAAAELLPALSRGVKLCGELLSFRGGSQVVEGEEAEAQRHATVQARWYLFSRMMDWAPKAVSAAVLLLVQHSAAAAGRIGGDGNGSGGGGGGGGGDGGGAERSRGAAAAAIAAAPSAGPAPPKGGIGAGKGADTPWRQLLLEEVRLLQLLGAATQVLHFVRPTVQLPSDVGWLASSLEHELRDSLSQALALAAAAFPADFRAAAGGGVDSSEGGAAGAGAAGSVGSGAATCISLPLVCEALERVGAEITALDPLAVVTRVVGGWDPTPEEVWGLARSCVPEPGEGAERARRQLQVLPTPAEARAAVDAAVADVGSMG